MFGIHLTAVSEDILAYRNASILKDNIVVAIVPIKRTKHVELHFKFSPSAYVLRSYRRNLSISIRDDNFQRRFRIGLRSSR